MDLSRPFTVYAPGLAGIAKDERYMSPGVVRRIVARGDANLVLRNVLLMIRDEEIREKELLKQKLKDAYRQEQEKHKKGDGPPAVLWQSKLAKFRGPWTGFLSDMQMLFRACKNFCVNGHLAGNCHASRSDDDRSKESRTQRTAGQLAG
jgi:hypothetical protein